MGLFSRLANSGKGNPAVIKSQYKIDRYARAYENHADMNELTEAAEDLIDEYITYYSDANVEWNECKAIMDVFDKYPLSYNGKKYSKYSGMLCEDVIRELRQGLH